MSLSELYQEVILDHGKNPRNLREMPDATHVAEGYNPLCGDQIKVFLRVAGDVVEDASFLGRGCAISQASASMMTQAIKGQTLAKAEELFENFRDAVTTQADGGCDHSSEPTFEDAFQDESLGVLSCLTGVRNYPNRIKCAVLAWHAMHSALHEGSKVTTE
ncbi:MAG: SUF system NifU family Fe-S cluster assembly protein [Armatimonadetes bacterium]|nr:SUF system NifU family Fe-S cluster assembly protein [Armatimonadota bacterium]